jgi:hypothetical protein
LLHGISWAKQGRKTRLLSPTSGPHFRMRIRDPENSIDHLRISGWRGMARPGMTKNRKRVDVQRLD